MRWIVEGKHVGRTPAQSARDSREADHRQSWKARQAAKAALAQRLAKPNPQVRP